MKTAWPVETLGDPTAVHPSTCVRWCDGAHRSYVFTAGKATAYATYDADWQPTLHTTGADLLSGDDKILHEAQVAYLLNSTGEAQS